MASLSWEDVERERLYESIHLFLYDPDGSRDIEDLWEQFMLDFGWDVNEESNPEIVQRLHDLLTPHIWNCLGENTVKLIELLTGLRDIGPHTFCDPIAFTLHYFHDEIVREARWDLWCAYSSLVGGFIQDALDIIRDEDLVLRILIQAFEYPHSPTVRPTLVTGAAMCLRQLYKPIARHIATAPEWDLRALVPGRTPVTPENWKYWTSCMQAFAAEPSNSPYIRQLAADAAAVMWIE
ncbi:hypothetical protein GGR55DRAFT_699886 [Xylaria sp. FL0064]|nr:hypothetical protein GGR55DRAFT_699886 [Xylaria sp. FL0064]